ncbi:hypothetical protein NL676_011812 [Syzygium grande]|nr:hypothetical protein NL676_011812 [Syzygium grande]
MSGSVTAESGTAECGTAFAVATSSIDEGETAGRGTRGPPHFRHSSPSIFARGLVQVFPNQIVLIVGHRG